MKVDLNKIESIEELEKLLAEAKRIIAEKEKLKASIKEALESAEIRPEKPTRAFIWWDGEKWEVKLNSVSSSGSPFQGKPVYVNGKEFPSANQAVRHIVETYPEVADWFLDEEGNILHRNWRDQLRKWKDRLAEAGIEVIVE